MRPRSRAGPLRYIHFLALTCTQSKTWLSFRPALPSAPAKAILGRSKLLDGVRVLGGDPLPVPSANCCSTQRGRPGLLALPNRSTARCCGRPGNLSTACSWVYIAPPASNCTLSCRPRTSRFPSFSSRTSSSRRSRRHTRRPRNRHGPPTTLRKPPSPCLVSLACSHSMCWGFVGAPMERRSFASLPFLGGKKKMALPVATLSCARRDLPPQKQICSLFRGAHASICSDSRKSRTILTNACRRSPRPLHLRPELQQGLGRVQEPPEPRFLPSARCWPIA